MGARNQPSCISALVLLRPTVVTHLCVIIMRRCLWTIQPQHSAAGQHVCAAVPLLCMLTRALPCWQPVDACGAGQAAAVTRALQLQPQGGWRMNHEHAHGARLHMPAELTLSG